MKLELEELYYGQQILCGALLDKVTDSLVEAYLEFGEAEESWKLVVAFDRTDGIIQEILEEIVDDFEMSFEGAIELDKLATVHSFDFEFVTQAEPTPYGEFEPTRRVYAFRRMTKEYLELLRNEQEDADNQADEVN